MRALAGRWLGVFWLQLFALMVVLPRMSVAEPAAGQRYELEIPAGNASSALRALAYQTDHALLFRAAEIDAVHTPTVNGRLTLSEALEQLFEGSDLVGHVTARGVIIISNKDESDGMRASNRKRGLLAATALAAVTPVGESLALEEVVVSAQRRSQSLHDVPISISVIGGDALVRENLLNLQDIATRVPTVKLVEGSGTDLINIRGVGSGRNAGFEQAVSTFVDSVYRGRSRSIRSALFDIERVEVLKGPQITFFGNNAIAGAFNITTRKPSQTFEASTTLLYEPEHGEYLIEGGITGPLTDTVSARLAVRASGMDGYIDNYWTGQDGPDLQERFARLSFAWEPSDTFRSDLRVDINTARNKGTVNQELIDCPPPAGYGNTSPTNACNRYLAANNGVVDDKLDYRSGAGASSSDLDMVEVAWTNRWTLGGGHQLVSTTAWYDHEAEVTGGLLPVPIRGVADAPTLFSHYTEDYYDQFSQELRLESPEGGFLEYMVGAYYARDHLWASGYQGAYFLPFGSFTGGEYGPDDPLASALFLEQESNTRSAFSSLTFHLLDDLRFNLGLRYTSVRKQAERAAVRGLAPGWATPDTLIPGTPAQQQAVARALGRGGPDLPFARPSRNDEDLMLSAAVQYDLSDNLMAYVSYTEGFKAGGYAQSSDPDMFGPEDVDAYEIGLKGSLFNRRLTFGLALYHNEYSGLQESVIVYEPSGAVVSRIRNVGEARSRGVDLNLQWAYNPYTVLLADIGYLDATYQDFPNGPCTVAQGQMSSSCVQDLSGKPKAWAPRWSGNVGFRFTYPVRDLEVSFAPTLSFTSSMFHEANADPLMKHHGYAKLDARLGVGAADGRWEVALVGRNLTDRAVASRITTAGTAPGTVTMLPERPRSVAVQLNMRY
jgi:outer membrane receptor protein involved in Fe transport